MSEELLRELEEFHERLLLALGKRTDETIYSRAATEIRRQDALIKMLETTSAAR